MWKSSFNEVVKEIGATPSEEIDLMIKWLGSESKEFALSIGLQINPYSEPTSYYENLSLCKHGKIDVRHFGPNYSHKKLIIKANHNFNIGF